MTLEAGKEMDKRCVCGWLNEVYRHPTVAFNTYSEEQQIEFAHDALVMLKEQEVRVMTLDQLEGALDTVVWLETPVSENLADGYSLIMAYSHVYGYMFFDSPFGDNPSQDRLEYSEYGRSWRCWDRRPSEEQRKAAKWNEID